MFRRVLALAAGLCLAAASLVNAQPAPVAVKTPTPASDLVSGAWAYAALAVKRRT